MKIYPEMDKEIINDYARLTAENQRLREEAAEQKSIAEHEHATQMEWFEVACDYKAENAELRSRLEKAVELPCKVGDTVYEKGMYEGDVYEHRIRKIIFDTEKISFDCTAIGNSIFLTRAEAEARLKEMKEKKDD